MTPTNATHATHDTPPTPAADATDLPAVILALETVSELADLVHRHRLSIARVRERLSALADELTLREAQALMTAEGRTAEERKAAVTLRLAADSDYQALKRKERGLKRELAELEADIERARVRIRITLSLLPTAEAVDWFSGDSDGSDGSRPGEDAGGLPTAEG